MKGSVKNYECGPVFLYPFFSFKFVWIILLLLMIACNAGTVAKVRSDANQLNIRYVNLGIIFDFMVNRDSGAKDLRKRKEDLLKSIDDTDRIIKNEKKESRRSLLLSKLQEYRSELDEVMSEQDLYKDKILNEIDTAIGGFAKRAGIDFIFNMGEGAIYAKKEYDITEEVLREIVNRKKRNAPVSR